MHELVVVEPPCRPRLGVADALRPQPLDRRRAQRCAVAEQPAQRQFEVALRQPVQVPLGQQIRHLLGAPREQRQHPTLKVRLQPAHPRPLEHDRPRLHGQPARLPVPVAIADRRIDPGAALVTLAAEQLRHLHLQELLHELLNLAPDPALQRLPRRPGLRASLSATPPHGRCLLPPGLTRALAWQPEGYVARSSFTHPLI